MLAITAEGEPIRVRIPEANRELVLQTANRFYNRVSNLQDNYLEPSQQLYRWLLAPLEAELQARGIQNYLFIMPDGLRLLPLAALHDGKQYVAQKYSTGYAPSLNLIDYRYRNIKESPVLAFGASQFETNQNQSNLPAVEIEVPLIARDIRKGTYVLDKEFTLQNLVENRNDNPYPIIHLATHADFQPGELSKSYIQLYDRKIGLNELRELGLSNPTVDLLVISACRSAYGDRNAELGFAGLAVQAGVKTAIASLWYVGDTGTLGLMSEFYRQLTTAPIKAEALRSAQVAMIEGQLKKQGNEIVGTRGTVPLPAGDTVADEDLTHPFYWSAFTTIGSPW
ncbi:MAG: CHAT domain-containing protein [Hydrococcus sp. RU_2_2]|nr:CHAT domain-containing protein [Hydrococcus sp. RU_2_2]